MDFKKFFIEGLFDLYDHTIDFSLSDNLSDKRASIIMLYGKNGIGKTTILRMIEGFINLNFNVFREVEFKQGYLMFSENNKIIVKGIYNKRKVLQHLEVQYKEVIVKLHPEKRGALNKTEQNNEIKLIELFDENLKPLSFEFINTERLMERSLKDKDAMRHNESLYLREGKIISRQLSKESVFLADKVKKFITESQVYNARFFSKEEPELFEKILLSIENPSTINIRLIKQKINAIVKAEKDFEIKRLGLAQEKWDKRKLMEIINIEQKKNKPDIHKLTVINSYLEVLESRNNERISLAERLLTFENILNEFLMDKKITISLEKGFEIKSIKGNVIQENKLSTGEYHLLYLTVLALCTTVKDTIIAIDEPEMSMHIGWQNKLIKALLKISSKANPQFIFATHSPDIAANYSNSLHTVTYGGKN